MLAKYFERLFRTYARFLGRHLNWFLYGPICVFVLLTLGWLRFDVFDDPRAMFTPQSSFWKTQEQIVWDYFDAEADGIVFVVGSLCIGISLS